MTQPEPFTDDDAYRLVADEEYMTIDAPDPVQEDEAEADSDQ